MSEKPSAAAIEHEICEQIRELMRVYREQAASSYGVDTPGGLEHMGDVWKLFRRWDEQLSAAPRRDECFVCKAALEPETFMPRCEDCIPTEEQRDEWESLSGKRAAPAVAPTPQPTLTKLELEMIADWLRHYLMFRPDQNDRVKPVLAKLAGTAETPTGQPERPSVKNMQNVFNAVAKRLQAKERCPECDQPRELRGCATKHKVHNGLDCDLCENLWHKEDRSVALHLDSGSSGYGSHVGVDNNGANVSGEKVDAGDAVPRTPPDLKTQVEICEQNHSQWMHVETSAIRGLLNAEHNLGIEVATRHFWQDKAKELALKLEEASSVTAHKDAEIARLQNSAKYWMERCTELEQESVLDSRTAASIMENNKDMRAELERRDKEIAELKQQLAGK